MWWEAFEAKFEGKGKPFGRDQFDKLLGHCQAVADNPCICFAEDLIAAYPEVKVILTLRPVDDWYRRVLTILHGCPLTRHCTGAICASLAALNICMTNM